MQYNQGGIITNNAWGNKKKIAPNIIAITFKRSFYLQEPEPWTAESEKSSQGETKCNPGF